jgi:hypothetical protein
MEIPPEVAAAEGVPEDLDSAAGGPYRFPDVARRRAAGFIYLVAAALVAVLLEPVGRWVMAGLLVALGLWHLAAAHHLAVSETEALGVSAGEVSFPIGHASATVGFSGWRSRPEWQVILYDAAEPPRQRALVRVDAITGDLLGEPYVEQISAAER